MQGVSIETSITTYDKSPLSEPSNRLTYVLIILTRSRNNQISRTCTPCPLCKFIGNKRLGIIGKSTIVSVYLPIVNSRHTTIR